jgi:hypothetical protein
LAERGNRKANALPGMLARAAKPLVLRLSKDDRGRSGLARVHRGSGSPPRTSSS